MRRLEVRLVTIIVIIIVHVIWRARRRAVREVGNSGLSVIKTAERSDQSAAAVA